MTSAAPLPSAASLSLAQDLVPKVVMALLVHKSRDDIASQLVHSLYSLITQPDTLLRGE